MKRAFTNYVVDVAIGSAFLVATVSSIVFLLPSDWISISSAGTTSLLGIDMATWSALHKWSGLAMIGGVVVHALLHTRWIVNMTRRVFGTSAPASGGSRHRGVVADAPGAPSAASSPAQPSIPVALAVATTPPARESRDEASLAVGPRRRGESAARDGDEHPRRYSRKAFLGAAVGVVAGAAVAGVALRDDGRATATGQTTGEVDQGGFGSTQTDELDESNAAPAQPQGAEGSSAGGATGQGPTTQNARVVVDTALCSGCGSCLQACPQGVFSFDGGGTATASSPNACALCGRCLQVCREQAITLNG